MDEQWLTYKEVGDRLGITPEAARSRAKRLGWRRQLNNSGQAVVLVALEPRPPGDGPVTPRSPPGRKSVDPALVTALESHIKTLQGDIETLKEQLSAAEARSAADLAHERARAETEAQTARKAVEAFAALADRLDALAAERRPWWRRIRIAG
jgi:hypothetical protein